MAKKKPPPQLDLSQVDTRTKCVLRRLSVNSVEKLLAVTAEELSPLRGCGSKTKRSIELLQRRYGKGPTCEGEKISVERAADCAENAILSPADGKVVGIDTVEEGEYLGGKARRISIFLSLFNVHINYSPISGTVEFMKYKRGRFVTAASARSAAVNAQNAVGIRNDSVKILVKQIAGILARRIVCRLDMNDNILRGEKFGLIRFGSRAEVYLPPECEVAVKVGQRVVGGITPLAVYQKP